MIKDGVHHHLRHGHYPPGLHRALTHLRKGGLHRALGIPEDKPIPEHRLEEAKNSRDEHVRHMAHMAAVMEHFDHSHQEHHSRQ